MEPKRIGVRARACRSGPGKSGRKGCKKAAPQERVVGADCEDQALDRGIHDRKQENARQADKDRQQRWCRVRGIGQGSVDPVEPAAVRSSSDRKAKGAAWPYLKVQREG